MSEFSDSFHLFGDRAAVRTLLTAAATPGLIVASNERCVSFVLAAERRDQVIVAASKGVLARLFFAEDHGLWLRFFHDGNELGVVEVVWDGMDPETGEEDEPPAPKCDDEVLAALTAAGAIDAEQASRVAKLARGFDIEVEGAVERLASEVATIFGFAAWHWLSSAYVSATEPEDLARDYPNHERVGGLS